MTTAPTARVLVCEPISDGGVELLRQRFDVDVASGWSAEDLLERVSGYDAIIVRSATEVRGDLLDRAARLRVIGRAGTGVDNVDVDEATRRGIIVCNAPGSNSLSAAEHAVALLMAQARNIPQAHDALLDGRWERAKYAGVEITGKTLGILGFGKIGQLVAERARGLQMRVVAYDPFAAEHRFRELGVDRADTAEGVYAAADFISLHMASTPETRGFVGREAFRAMKRSARLINAARGDVVDQAALIEALQQGEIAGAAIDVFPDEPTTESPLFGLPGVVVTPHLGASTAEAQDRAGIVVAEQVTSALTGGVVSGAVNIPALSEEALAVLGPFLPLARQMGQLLAVLGKGVVSPLEITYEGQLAELDTQLLTNAILVGILHGHSDEPVNMVNAPALARSRGIEWSALTTARERDYTNLLELRAGSVSLGGTTIGTTSRPRLVSLFGQEIDIELARYVGIFRYLDVPGMIGRVGSILGGAHINIASMAVSRSLQAGHAVMAVTVDSMVPNEVAAEIAGIDGFDQVWFASLDAV
jgi:D-3-phosphoglycerate dehydrogenase / 2-oxoglutarate reductase